MIPIKKIHERLSNLSEFNKNFGKLFSISIIIGGVSLLCIPIISRLYTPEELGQFQLILSIIVVLSSISSFKYEMSIVLPKYKYQSHIMFDISIIALIISTLIYCGLFYFLSEVILSYFNAESLKQYVVLMLLSIFLSGLYQIVQMRLVSDGNFNQLSLNKGAQSISNNILGISAGIASPSFSSLVISYLSSIIISLILSFTYLKKNRKVNFKLLARYAKKYRKFPIVNTSIVFINNFSMNLPIFVLTEKYSFEVVGYFMLASRILDMPISFISGSLSQVYTKYAADDYKISPSKLKNRYKDTLKKLAAAACCYIILIVSIVTLGLEKVLGEDWVDVNYMVLALLFSKVFQLLNSSLSSTFMIVNKQEIGLMLIVLFSILRYLSLSFDFEILTTLFIYSCVTSVFYIVYNLSMYRSIK